ncbi:MAG TPA: phage holin family protein [Polyangia bacterium]|jgi:putative membrane protein|nr:phage holin family protein [Polyangia bacterium]
MLIPLLLHLVVLTATVLLLARFLPSVRIKSVGAAIVVALVFSVLNILLGWFIRAVLFVPAVFTFGLLFLFLPFIVNAVLLWLTDKLIKSFEIESIGGLLTSAAVITLVNWLFHVVAHSQRMGLHGGAGPTRWI